MSTLDDTLEEQSEPGASDHQIVSIYDLLGGYVGDDHLIEVVGHFEISADGASLSAGMPSAMAPIRVDVAHVPQKDFGRLVQECFALRLGGGCRATIRGQTGRLDNLQAIFATSVILHIAPQRAH